MASNITSAGSASGMDFESIIAASVEAKKTQLEKQTNVPYEESNIQLSGISKLKSALEEFQKALETLNDSKGFNVRKVSIDQPSDNPYFSISTKDDAANAAYDIAVEQLASTEQLTMKFDKNSDEKTMFAPGKLTITLPPTEKEDGTTEENKVTIEIKEPTDVAGLRRLINEQAGDRGISASVLETSSGSMLTIDSGVSGSKHKGEFTFSYEIDENYTNTDKEYDAEKAKANAALLNYSGSKDVNDGDQVNGWTVRAPKDAIIKVNGAEITSDTNTFSEQISGIELTVKRTTKDEDKSTSDNPVYKTVSTEISQDNDAIVAKVQAFVSAYNTLNDTMTALGKRNTYSEGANNYDGGELAGDSQLLSLQRQLQSFMTNLDASDGISPYNLGLEVDKDGKFKLDETKFKEGLEDNFNAVVKLFTNAEDNEDTQYIDERGMIVQLNSIIEDYTEANGLLDKRTEEINSTIKDLEDKANANALLLEQYEAGLRQKYANLDTTIAGYNQSLMYIQSVLG